MPVLSSCFSAFGASTAAPPVGSWQWAGEPPAADSLPPTTIGAQPLSFKSLTMRPRPGSCGESSTHTLSPGRTRTKFFTAAPAACTRTCCRDSSSTRQVAFGSSSNTVATTPFDSVTRPNPVRAWSTPRARSQSRRRNARSAPNKSRRASPPSTGPAGPWSPACPH